MDRARFKQPSGRLVAVEDGDGIAFVPEPMPTAWEPPSAMARLWVEARDVVGELRGTGHSLHDHALLIRPLRQREALRSSSLEGTYATPGELLAYEKDPRDPRSVHDPANAWREVFNYQQALETGQQLVQDGYPFSEWLIRQLHARLLNGVRGEDKSPGDLRKTQVHIGADHRFTPAPPSHLTELMAQLERAIQEPSETDPLIRALLVHYQFETIHPFREGNGRVGRLLLALMIYRDCGFDLPWLYLSEFFEKHRDEYIDALFAVSAESDWARWVGLGLRATIAAGRETIARIKRLLEIRQSYEDRIREHAGRDRLVHILPKLLSSPYVDYADIQEALGVSYPTARADMQALIDMGIVVELPPRSPRLFYAAEIFQAAYHDE